MIVIKSVIFTLVHLAVLVSVQGKDRFSNVHKWPSTKVSIYYPFIDSKSVTWAVCDRSESWYTQRSCFVMREIYHFNGTSAILSCNVNLMSNDENGTLYDHLKVISFGEDRAILVSAQKVKGLKKGAVLQFNAIHFPKCNIVQNNLLYTDEFSSYELSNFDLLDHLVTITAYNDKYDVIFKNKTLCNKKLCILSIDKEGKIIRKPEILAVDDFGDASTLGSLPVSSNSVSKGQVLTQRDEYFKKENQIALILPSGVKRLTNVKRSSGGPWISMAHNRIGFCDLIQLSDFENSYICAQYDQKGNLVKEMNLDFKSIKVIRSLHNLADGGFLLFASEDKIIKIDSEGKIIPFTFTVKNFSCEKGLSFNDAFIFEKDNKKVCVSRVCSLTPTAINVNEVPRLDFAVECFTYDILKKVIGDVKTH